MHAPCPSAQWQRETGAFERLVDTLGYAHGFALMPQYFPVEEEDAVLRRRERLGVPGGVVGMFPRLLHSNDRCRYDIEGP